MRASASAAYCRARGNKDADFLCFGGNAVGLKIVSNAVPDDPCGDGSTFTNNRTRENAAKPPEDTDPMLTYFNNLKILYKISVTLVVLMAINVAVSAISGNSIATQQQASGWTEHTYKVLARLEGVVAAMVDQETGMRGYVISSNPNFLEPQKAGAAAYADNLAQLRALTSDNPVQQRRLDDLDTLVKTWTQRWSSRKPCW